MIIDTNQIRPEDGDQGPYCIKYCRSYEVKALKYSISERLITDNGSGFRSDWWRVITAAENHVPLRDPPKS